MSAPDKDFRENKGRTATRDLCHIDSNDLLLALEPSLQSKTPSLSTTYDATESKREASPLDSDASQDLAHSRSERVGNSSTTSDPEQLRGSCNTHELIAAPYVDLRSASKADGVGADRLPAPSLAVPQPSRSSKQAAEQGTLDAPPSRSIGEKSGALKSLYRKISADVRVIIPSKYFM